MPEPSSQDQAIRAAHEGGGRVFSGARGTELVESAGESRAADASLARALGRSAPQGEELSAAYLTSLGSRARLTPVEERRLILAAQAGDRRARATLVEAFMPLIGSVARLYRETVRVERIELLQEGVVGLLRALERFDPERGTPFWAFAAWWVRQAMQQLVSELARPIVLSDRALRKLARIRDAQRELLQRDGREPSSGDIADATGLPREQVDRLIAAERNPRALEEPVGGDHDAGTTLGELLDDPRATEAFERIPRSLDVAQLPRMLGVLNERERTIITARFGLEGSERTLRELGESLGVSAERVRQIEEASLGKLRTALSADNPL
jgi:RNA polymerase sigma factor (sigma-70 family)